MTYIKKELLERTIEPYISNLSLAEQLAKRTELLKEITSSKTKRWESYLLDIDTCKEKLEKEKNKTILGKASAVDDRIWNLYVLLRGAIAKIESNLTPKWHGITLTEIAVSLGLFSAKINSDPNKNDDKKTYINNQINYLVETIKEIEKSIQEAENSTQEVENPTLLSSINDWVNSLRPR